MLVDIFKIGRQINHQKQNKRTKQNITKQEKCEKGEKR